jgi:hypothetical protein
MKKKFFDLQSHCFTVARFLEISELFQQAQASAGAAEALSVRFQQVFTAVWNCVVALLQPDRNT